MKSIAEKCLADAIDCVKKSEKVIEIISKENKVTTASEVAFNALGKKFDQVIETANNLPEDSEMSVVLQIRENIDNVDYNNLVYNRFKANPKSLNEVRGDVEGIYDINEGNLTILNELHDEVKAAIEVVEQEQFYTIKDVIEMNRRGDYFEKLIAEVESNFDYMTCDTNIKYNAVIDSYSEKLQYFSDLCLQIECKEAELDNEEFDYMMEEFFNESDDEFADLLSREFEDGVEDLDDDYEIDDSYDFDEIESDPETEYLGEYNYGNKLDVEVVEEKDGKRIVRQKSKSPVC